MMKTIRTSVLCCFFLSVPFLSMAWGVLGHRIVGEIADSYLTTKAKAEIQKILGTESMAITSNWADFIKSDSTYNYLGSWHYINLDKGMSKEQLLGGSSLKSKAFPSSSVLHMNMKKS